MFHNFTLALQIYQIFYTFHKVYVLNSSKQYTDKWKSQALTLLLHLGLIFFFKCSQTKNFIQNISPICNPLGGAIYLWSFIYRQMCTCASATRFLRPSQKQGLSKT